MALVLQKFTKIRCMFARVSVRCFSMPVNTVKDKDIKKSVFISQSNDIFTNLALEDWLYRNFDFTHHHVLMLWRNDPCVVIGRHQNPWLEANIGGLSEVTEKGVQLARRNSGGGTVYHDQGNLNMTFFTTNEHYNRKYNLELITRAVFRKYGVGVDISQREDLTVRGFKVSGTAAKLGRPNAYHHCTLLVEVNKVNMRLALQQEEVDIKTNASRSIRSQVCNMCEENPRVSVNGLLAAVGWEYMRTPVNSLKDGGKLLANQQKGFQMINPTEQWFPGITELRNDLSSWEWCYGKTPKFTITRAFPLPSHLISDNDGMTRDLRISLVTEQGIITDVTLLVPPGLSVNGLSSEAKVITGLIGQKFTTETMHSLELALNTEYHFLGDDQNKFVTHSVRQVMTSV